MKKMILLCLFVSWLINVNSRTLVISNIGNKFFPQVTVAQIGDTIDFQLASDHNAIEVSKADWEGNLNIPIPGGFTVPFGGGEIVLNNEGEKYFVCGIHHIVGMKGIILVMPKNTIAYTGFEGQSTEWIGTGIGALSILDTMQILRGDTATGFDGEPSSSRIYDGLRSWQVNDVSDTIVLSPINTSGYDSLNLKFRFTGTSINPGQGIDDNDSILVYISLNGNAFNSIPTLTINGNNNNTWGFDADSIIRVSADSFSIYSVPPFSADSTSTSSTATIFIPFSTVQVKIMMIMINNQNKEVWSMDAITLRGVKSRALPLIDHLFYLEKTNLNKVKIGWSFKSDDNYQYQFLQRSQSGIEFADICRFDSESIFKNDYLEFIDLIPFPGFNYYRIKSVNINGDVEYSMVKSIYIESKSNQYKLYPTIATDYIYLVNSKPDEINQLQFIYLNGSVFPFSMTPNGQSFYIGHLTAGIYKITCRTKQGIEVLSFIKM